MHYGNILGIEKPISRLVQGTAMVNNSNQDWALDLFDTVFELGCTTFDTAHGYENGLSERLLGRWLRERGHYDKAVIITKGAHPYNGRKRVTPADITSDIHESLERLNIETIDLYLLHRDDPDVPVGPIVEVLNEHKAAGKIKAFGGSNWSRPRIQEANEYATAHGLTPFSITSPNLSLAEQIKEPWPDCISITKDAESRAWYTQNQMPLFAWSSVAGGFFSGRYTRDNLDTFDQYFEKVCVETYCYEPNFQRYDRAVQLAQQKAVTVPQVALAYVMSQPLNLFALVAHESRDELATNMAALDLKLTPDELAWLEAG
jgi:aryl-alcohol dehydrogenase-like predicted oxidoreductase